MNIIIVGCGRFGSSLAKILAEEGNNICIIDRSKDKLDALGSGFNANRVKGIEFDKDVLLEAGIESCDLLIAGTQNDNINVTVAMISSRIFHVRNVIARVNDPEKLYLYNKLGIKTINPVQFEIDCIYESIRRDVS